MSKAPLPFHPHDGSFNRGNALYLAHAADVAYDRAPAAAAAERLGLEAVAFRHSITRTRGFLGVCKTHAVLAFRGSDPGNGQTWLTDLVINLVESRDYEGRVHCGFSSVLQLSWDKIAALLEAVRDKPLFITGHSMGGALSVLAACRLAKIGRPPVATYTFGAPRVGDRAFCSAYCLPTYRVVNRLDLVPEIPLASVPRLLPQDLGLKKPTAAGGTRPQEGPAPSYGHVNTLVYIDRNGLITPNANVEPWHTHAVARAIATRGKSFMEGITDHLIASYIRGIGGPPNTDPPRVHRPSGKD